MDISSPRLAMEVGVEEGDSAVISAVADASAVPSAGVDAAAYLWIVHPVLEMYTNNKHN